MRVAALLERTSDGWRAWAPALPGVEVVSETSAAAEEDLARAVEKHIRARWADGTMEQPPDIRAFSVEVRRAERPERRTLRQTEEDKLRTLQKLDAVLEEGAILPSFIVNAVFKHRRELQDSLPEEDIPEPEPEEDGLPAGVLRFAPRDR